MHTLSDDSGTHAQHVVIHGQLISDTAMPFSWRLQVVQQDVMCLSENATLVPCVENRRWQYNGVTYITLNVAGQFVQAWSVRGFLMRQSLIAWCC